MRLQRLPQVYPPSQRRSVEAIRLSSPIRSLSCRTSRRLRAQPQLVGPSFMQDLPQAKGTAPARRPILQSQAALRPGTLLGSTVTARAPKGTGAEDPSLCLSRLQGFQRCLHEGLWRSRLREPRLQHLQNSLAFALMYFRIHSRQVCF